MKKIKGFVACVCIAALLGGCGLLPFSGDDESSSSDASSSSSEVTSEDTSNQEAEIETSEDASEVKEDTSAEKDTVLEKAKLQAAQYDYDTAIATVQAYEGYENDADMTAAIKEFEDTKATCVAYPTSEITHVFFHCLIVDTARAFDGDGKQDGYNQYMTTMDEFNKIIQSMYDKGYVMVRMQDMAPATVNADGTKTFSAGSIMLPPGKKAFVLSQDDESYYHTYEGDGFADKMVVDDNGEVKCQYTDADGNVSIGDYDMVPLIDSFVKEHPDFSYRGAKGILVMTGYDGVLGYRTDIQYKIKESLQEDQQKWLDAHPDFDFDQDVADATKVADAMKENGWLFANHTWGHRNVSDISLEGLKEDTQKWMDNVAPILGNTDMAIFAFGADLGDWTGYSGDKYEYMKSMGFDYYCNVDSNQYWVQITDDYVRMGRRNLDGYRMYYNPDMLSDLFDVSAVFDSSRPTPVPELGAGAGH